ncbi:hypothetical protein ACFL0V_05055 [Nanoarchaeota archaeon]
MKRKIAVLLMVAMLFIFGCGGGGEQDQQGVAGSQFAGGDVGLSIGFAEGSIPSEIFDRDYQFGISLVIKNLGDHDIENGGDVKAKITGIDPSDFGVSANDLEQSPTGGIRGAQKDATGASVAGETISLDFPTSGASFAYQKEIAGSIPYNIKVDVCYKYGTVVNTKLCVLEDILGTTGQQGLCEINQDKPVDNSGAPVKVTSFRESVSSSNKVAFVFKIQHTGGGKVHQLASDCTSDFQNRDKVHVKIDTGLSDGLTCSGLQNGQASGSVYEGDATLLNQAREIRCTQDINNPTDIEKLVRIDLTYDYKDSLTQQLMVKHVGG